MRADPRHLTLPGDGGQHRHRCVAGHSGKALVQAMDQHGNGWGNGVPLNAIPPGGQQTVVITGLLPQG